MTLNKKSISISTFTSQSFSMSAITSKSINLISQTYKNFSFMINNFKIGLLLSFFDPQTLATLDTEILRDMDYTLL